MVDDPPMEPPLVPRDRTGEERRRGVVAAGHRGDRRTVDEARDDPDPAVRVARLGAMQRLSTLSVDELALAFVDPEPAVRRRASVLAARVRGPGSRSMLPVLLVEGLSDHDPLVAEAAAWSLGERRWVGSVPALAAMARDHADPRCREAAVAALGAIGDEAGLPAVIAALGDRPPVRRRAVVALAGFRGSEVEDALSGCLEDPDWQVRQAAEILLGR